MSNVLPFKQLNTPKPGKVGGDTFFYTVDQIVSPKQLQHLFSLRTASLGKFKATVFAAPGRLGDITPLLEAREWLTIGMYGWEGCAYECRYWFDDIALEYLKRGLKLGYAPLFMAPWHIWDSDLVGALNTAGVALMHRGEQSPEDLFRAYPGKREDRLKFPAHSHVYTSAVAMEAHPMFKVERVQSIRRFLDPTDLGLLEGKDATRIV